MGGVERKYIFSYEGPFLCHLATTIYTRINLFLTTSQSVKIAFILWLSHSYISTSSFSAIQGPAVNKLKFELGTIAVGLVFSI